MIAGRCHDMESINFLLMLASTCSQTENNRQACQWPDFIVYLVAALLLLSRPACRAQDAIL